MQADVAYPLTYIQFTHYIKQFPPHIAQLYLIYWTQSHGFRFWTKILSTAATYNYLHSINSSADYFLD